MMSSVSVKITQFAEECPEELSCQEKSKTVSNISKDNAFQDLSDSNGDLEVDEPRLFMDYESDGCPSPSESNIEKDSSTVDINSLQSVEIVDKSRTKQNITSSSLEEIDVENKKIEIMATSDNVNVAAVATEASAEKRKPKRRANRAKVSNVSTEDKDKVYKCTKCFFESQIYSSFVLHICKPLKGQTFTVKYNKEGNIYSCTCDYIYHKLKPFHEHLVSHIIAKPFRCSQCKEMGSTRKEILKHISSSHPNTKMRFYVNGLKYTQCILQKAQKYGSYTHKFEDGKKAGETSKTPKSGTWLQTDVHKIHNAASNSLRLPTLATSTDNLIIIDEPDDPVPESSGIANSLMVQSEQQSAKTIKVQIPIGLSKTVNLKEMFKFNFSSTGVKYSCTVCAKEWESRSTFCFHIWSHQHEMGKRCAECDKKPIEAGVTCMATIRLFRKLAFASFTKTKQEAEKNGALKDLALCQISCSMVNFKKVYKCLICNVSLQQLSNLKWHIWQHSHSEIICPACSIMGTSGTRYIICPLVEKLVNRLEQKEVLYDTAQKAPSNFSPNSIFEDKNCDTTVLIPAATHPAKKYGTIMKNNETVYVCYVCCKQWTDKVRFWLHVWTHFHKDKKLCNKCKPISAFPGMICTMVDKEVYLSESIIDIQQLPQESISLEEDMIITSFEPGLRSPTINDIVIIEDTPGPGPKFATPTPIVQSRSTDSDSTASTLITIDDDDDHKNGDSHNDDHDTNNDEAEVTIDIAADVTCTGVSFSENTSNILCTDSSNMSSNPSVIVANIDSNIPIATTVLLHPQISYRPSLTKEDIEKSNFSPGLRRDFLTSEKLCQAVSRFIATNNQEFVCLICKTSFVLNELIQLHEHLIVKHMKIPLVQCGHCDFNANKDCQVSNHCRLKHPGKDVRVIGYEIDIQESVEQYVNLIKFKPPEILTQIFKQPAVNVVQQPQKVVTPLHAETNSAAKQPGHQKKSTTITDASANICHKEENNTSSSASVKLEVCADYHSVSDDFKSSDRGSSSNKFGPQIVSTYSLAVPNEPTTIVSDTIDQSSTSTYQKLIKTEQTPASYHSYFTNNFFSCGLCDYSALIMEDLRKHLFSQHSSHKQFPCNHCGFIGLRADQLMKHFVYHTNITSPSISVFECIENDCEFRCNILGRFVKHLETHNLLEFECHECAELKDNVEDLVIHYEMNLLLVMFCPHCKAVATDRQTLLDHITQCHNGLSNIFSSGKQLVCRDRQLYGYERTCKPTNSLISSPLSTTEKQLNASKNNEQDVVELVCKLCSFYAGSPQQLSAHNKVHFRVQEDLQYLCPFCKDSFEKEKSLEDHLTQHAETQMLVCYFECKQDGYRTNVYQSILEHVLNGQHTLTTKPEDMFISKQTSLSSGVICCPQCAFKSSCRSYLTCHIQKAHSQTILQSSAPEELSSKEVVTVPTHVFKCSKDNCNYITYSGNDLDEHLELHESGTSIKESSTNSEAAPFSDINTYKKDFHIYIPTDGPENQENLHLFAKRVKKLCSKNKENFKCKLCNFNRPDQTLMLKHLVAHLKISFRCYMCTFINKLQWRMAKHAAKEHNCKHFNIIYSDKIEEVSKILLKGGKRPGTDTGLKDAKTTGSSVPISRGKTLRRGRKRSTVEESVLKSSKDHKESIEIDKNVPSISNAQGETSRKNVRTLGRRSMHKRDEYHSDDASESSVSNDPSWLPTEEVQASTKSVSEQTKMEPVASIQWSTSITEKNMCLLGSDYLDASLSCLYSTENNKHQCNICKHMFPAITRYWIHHHLNLNHLKINLYQCGYCELRAIEKFKIHQHIAKKHPEKCIKVKDIDVNINHAVYNFIKKSNLNIKLPTTFDVEMNNGIIPEKICCEPTGSDKTDVHKLYRCEHCQENFYYEIKAKMHSNSVHPDIDPLIKIVYQKSTGSPIDKERIVSKTDIRPLKRKFTEEVMSPCKKVKTSVKDTIYKCPQCDFTTAVSLDAMDSHFRSHKYEKILICSFCEVRTFNDNSSKKHHRLSHPMENEKFNLLPIMEFFKVVTVESTPNAISAIDSETYVFTCKFCGLKSNKRYIMKDHLLQHLGHLGTNIICSVCCKPIPDCKSRQDHFMKVHKSKENCKNFKLLEKEINRNLDECYSGNQSPVTRAKSVSKKIPKNFGCVQCPTSFENLDELGRHCRCSHKNSCNMKTYWKDAVTGGTFNLHGLMIDNKGDLSNKKVFLCKFCQFRCSVRCELSIHLKSHIGKKMQRTIELRFPDDDTKTDSSPHSIVKRKITFCCYVCPAKADNLKKYSEHLGLHTNVFHKLKPSETNKKLFRCRSCSYRSESMKCFVVHLDTHVAMKQYSCVYCPFDTNLLSQIKLHVNSVHPTETVTRAIADMRSPQTGTQVNLFAAIQLKNFFEMSPNEFECLLNSARIQDVDLSRVPSKIVEKLLLAYCHVSTK